MGEHQFGVCRDRGRIKAKVGGRIDRIARKHGAGFTWALLPGMGSTSWFSCPNRGEPFDSATEREVWSALEAVGLAKDGRLVDACFRATR